MEHQTTQTLRFGAATIIVHRPNLTEQERAKRERQAQNALAGAMRDYMNKKGK